jgi:hypothetical protein
MYETGIMLKWANVAGQYDNGKWPRLGNGYYMEITPTGLSWGDVSGTSDWPDLTSSTSDVSMRALTREGSSGKEVYDI